MRTFLKAMFSSNTTSKVIVFITLLFMIFMNGGVLLVWAITNKTPDQLGIGVDLVQQITLACTSIVATYFAKSGFENCRSESSASGTNISSSVTQDMTEVKNTLESVDTIIKK